MATKKKPVATPELWSIVYYTRYALTAGILKLEVARDLGDGYLSLLAPKDDTSSYTPRYVASSKEWTPDPQEAIKRAETMRQRKIAALKKQLAALEAMTFTVPE